MSAPPLRPLGTSDGVERRCTRFKPNERPRNARRAARKSITQARKGEP